MIYRGKYKLVVAYLSFMLDHECLAQSIRSVRMALPDAHICVFDDGEFPIHNADKIDCDHYEQTHFDRHGNLNGKDCCVGVQTCLRRACEIAEADYVIKLDCDTLMLSSSWLNRLDESEPIQLGWQVKGCPSGVRYMHGPCYVVRRDVFAQSIPMIETLDPIPTAKYYPEDYIMGLCCDGIDPCKMIMEYGGTGSGLSGWLYASQNGQHPSKLDDLSDGVRQVISAGNRKQLNMPMLKRYKVAAQTMQAIIDYASTLDCYPAIK